MTRRHEHLPMRSLYWCQDCDECGTNPRTCCCCGSVSLLGLAAILNRPQQGEIERMIEAYERMEKR
jgi:hypothetical protein